MPIYEYVCRGCGDFSAMRRVLERDLPIACPSCDAPAARAILSAPATRRVAAEVNAARAINERAANEPKRYSGSDPAQSLSSSGTRSSCRASLAGTRPWMIGH